MLNEYQTETNKITLQIPSTYGPERLDLLRQLKKVKELEADASLTEKAGD